MQVTILAFGIAKDIIGTKTIDLELPSGSTVSSLKEKLTQKFPAFQRLVSLAVAVNASYAADDQILMEEDEIVLIPPVSGG